MSLEGESWLAVIIWLLTFLPPSFTENNKAEEVPVIKMIKWRKVFENNCFLILARHRIVTFVFFINVFIKLNEIWNAPRAKLFRDAFCFGIKVMCLRPEEGFRDEESHFQSSFIPLIAALSQRSRHLGAPLFPPALFCFSLVNVRNVWDC